MNYSFIYTECGTWKIASDLFQDFRYHHQPLKINRLGGVVIKQFIFLIWSLSLFLDR